MERAAMHYLRRLLALGLALAGGLSLVACGVTPAPRGVQVNTTPRIDYSNFTLETPTLPVNLIQTILPPTMTPVAAVTPTIKKIAVYINGAVEKPGVYSFAEGSRVVDALQMAGGFLPSADGDSINQAAPLRDGQQVYVPFKGTPAPPGLQPGAPPAAQPTGSSAAPVPSGPINLNTATKAELDTLPGIGPALADRIIEYRQKNGPFQRPEDIKKVSGIGDKVYENIKDRITAP
ncbi:MAG: helix-hairpin-helix domain-containing protein [Anaerolineae bacterium]|nr:helix-hairpin-helix domain-containing protein [Anaerolineae bacterium]